MASPIWWTWIWAISRNCWWAGKPGLLQSMELQSWTWLSNWTELRDMCVSRSVVSDSLWPHTVAHQAPLSMEFSRQRYWLLLLLSRFSRVWLCANPQTAAHQAPLSLGFSRQGHWSGLPFPSPGDLPDPGVESKSLASPALAGGFFTITPSGKSFSKCKSSSI